MKTLITATFAIVSMVFVFSTAPAYAGDDYFEETNDVYTDPQFLDPDAQDEDDGKENKKPLDITSIDEELTPIGTADQDDYRFADKENGDGGGDSSGSSGGDFDGDRAAASTSAE